MEYNYNQSGGYNQSNQTLQPGGYPNNLNETFYRIRGEKKAIHIIGCVSGICVIAYVLIQNALSVPIAFFPKLLNLFKNSDEFYYLFTITASVAGLLVPFIIGGNYLKKRTGAEIYYLDPPRDKALAILSVPMGFLICIFGNVLTSIFVAWMSNIGLKLTSPEFDMPDSSTGLALYIIAIAIVPPLVEELAIRGCIMQPLRRYGDRFAIIASAFLFAVLHGNLVQAPFALLAGLAFGYICCITGSLWPSIIIHFVNNLYSVFETIIFTTQSEEKAEFILTVSEYFFIGLGAVCTAAFVYRGYKSNCRLGKSPTLIKGGAKAFAYTVNIPMIIALLIMLFVTSQYVGLAK